MIEPLLNDEQLPISASEGWHQMNLLLNEELPTAPGINNAARYRLWFAAAVCMAVIMLTAIKTYNVDTPPYALAPGQHSGQSTNAPAKTIARGESAIGLHNYNTARVQPLQPQVTAAAALIADGKDLNIRAVATNTTKQQLPAFASVHRALAAGNNRLLADTLAKVPPPTLADNMALVNANKPVKQTSQRKPWQVLLGMGANIGIGQPNNLQPYPAAYVQYALSPQWFVKAGVALFAPMPGNVYTANRQLYVNDTASNVLYYHQKNGFSNRVYSNIEVLTGRNIGNGFSLEAGVQYAVLGNYKTIAENVPYDFQQNRIDAARSFINPAMLAAAPPTQSFTLRGSEVRLMAGVHYTAGKVVAGLQYQHGLQPVLAAGAEGRPITRMVSLQVLYRLR